MPQNSSLKRSIPQSDSGQAAPESEERSAFTPPSDQLVASPVHALQGQLSKAYPAGDRQFSRRKVYSLVIVFCFAVWSALFNLAATLF